jgi:hypothetical protein
MICLIGEQNVPNLLAIRDQNPDVAVLLYTDLTEKFGVLHRLQSVVEKEREVVAKKVKPYDIANIELVIRKLLEEHSWQPNDVAFNLTGGTKTMALAGYNLAREWQCPFVYLQSEGKKSRRYTYQWINGRHELSDDAIIDELFDLDDYLQIHLGDTYALQGFREPFEKVVYDALTTVVEGKAGINVAGKLEIDLIVRHTNQVGIIEVKTGKAGHSSEGIKQLNSAARREYLGTYTQKILVTQIEPHPNTIELAEISNVLILHLPESTQGGLSINDRERLIEGVLDKLGAPK